MNKSLQKKAEKNEEEEAASLSLMDRCLRCADRKRCRVYLSWETQFGFPSKHQLKSRKWNYAVMFLLFSVNPLCINDLYKRNTEQQAEPIHIHSSLMRNWTSHYVKAPIPRWWFLSALSSAELKMIITAHKATLYCSRNKTKTSPWWLWHHFHLKWDFKGDFLLLRLIFALKEQVC